MLEHLLFTVSRAVGGRDRAVLMWYVLRQDSEQMKVWGRLQEEHLSRAQESRVGGWHLVPRAGPCRAGGLQCHRKQPWMCSSRAWAGEAWCFFGHEFILNSVLFSFETEKSLDSWAAEPQRSDLNPFDRWTVEMLIISRPWNSNGEQPSSCLTTCSPTPKTAWGAEGCSVNTYWIGWDACDRKQRSASTI